MALAALGDEAKAGFATPRDARNGPALSFKCLHGECKKPAASRFLLGVPLTFVIFLIPHTHFRNALGIVDHYPERMSIVLHFVFIYPETISNRHS